MKLINSTRRRRAKGVRGDGGDQLCQSGGADQGGFNGNDFAPESRERGDGFNDTNRNDDVGASKGSRNAEEVQNGRGSSTGKGSSDIAAQSPCPWKHSNAKAELVKELLDAKSPIQKMSIEEIHQSDPKYNVYKYDNFYSNVRRLEKKYGISLPKKKKKSVAPKRDARGKPNKVGAPDAKKTKGWSGSQAKQMAMKLLMDKKCSIHKMTDKAIYESDSCFLEFSFGYFKNKLSDLRKSVERTRAIIEEQEQDFWKERIAHPRPGMTCRGYPFWDDHPARALLQEDVKSGLTDTLKPAELRDLREEYGAFPLKVFRGHIYQEKRDQREAGYWIPKRNKDAQKKRDEEAKKLKAEWEDDRFDEDIEALCQQWEQLGTLSK